MILSEKTIAISAVSKHLFFAVLALLTFCLAGFNAVAQDKIPFGPNDTLDEIRAKIKHNGYNFTVDHNWVFDLSPEQKAKMFPRRHAPMPFRLIALSPPRSVHSVPTLPSAFSPE